MRLLALHDYDAIAIAKIVREAGCSVGAFYPRFHNKDAFLYHVIASEFRRLQNDATSKLDLSVAPHETTSANVQWIVRHVVEAMTERKAMGVIRATIKLAAVMPMAIEPFEAYRKIVSDQAVALLAPELHKTTMQAVRIGIQIAMGTVTDAVLQKRPGPMLAGTPRMIVALTHVMAGYLGISGKRWSGNETEGEDTRPIHVEITEEPPEDGSLATFDPEFRRYIKKRRASATKLTPAVSKPRQARPALPSQSKKQVAAVTKPSKTPKATRQPDTMTIKVVKPPKTPPPSPERKPSRPKRRRRVV